MGKGRDKPPMYYHHKGLRDGDKVHGTSLRRAVNACPGFCSWKVDVLSRNFTAHELPPVSDACNVPEYVHGGKVHNPKFTCKTPQVDV